MTIIECKDPKAALNLNPKQIFVFDNERTRSVIPDVWAYSQHHKNGFEFGLLATTNKAPEC